MIRFEDIYDTVKRHHPGADLEILRTAYVFSALEHKGQTRQSLREDRRLRIARETMDIYAPLAGRLGMSKIKNELEDLSFQYLEPEAYKDLSVRVGERRKQAIAFIEKLKATVAEKLTAAAIEASLEGRIKRLYSIHHKLRR